MTEVADPIELYRDVAVLVDPSRSLTNGNPGTLALWLDALNLAKGKSVLHLGCGTGYYTAVIAEVVGATGQVTAAEIDPTLDLARYGDVQVIEGDGGVLDTGVRNAILINAGVTHPTESWLDNLRTGGSLVLPLTIDTRWKGNGAARFQTRIWVRRAFPSSSRNDLFMQQRSGSSVRQPFEPTVHVRYVQLCEITAQGLAFGRIDLLAAHSEFLPLDTPEHLIDLEIRHRANIRRNLEVDGGRESLS